VKLVALPPLPDPLRKALELLRARGVESELLAADGSPSPGELSHTCSALLAGAAEQRELVERLRASVDADSLAVAVFGTDEHAGRAALDAGADLWLDPRESAETLAARLDALLRRAAPGGAHRVDSLTGLLGHATFAELLLHEMERAKRYKRPMSVLAIEPDDPERAGPAAARDTLMRHVAASLRESVRDVDLLARLGPDRFALLLPETDARGALKAAERLREAVASRDDVAATVSIGAAGFPSRGMEAPEHVLGRSLESLLQALRAGGNRVVPFGAPDVVWAKNPPDPAQI